MKTFLILTLLSNMLLAAPKVVYGEDDRVDVFESTNAMFVELSKSTAAMISTSRLSSANDGLVSILGRTLADNGRCESERFSHQVVAANCSGFLVAEDLLVTAGHCIRTEVDCKENDWVFGFKVENDTQSDVSVEKENIYKCKEIISQSLNPLTKDDYALIRLDRKVKDRAPLNFRKRGKVKESTSLVVIGHPSGLPTKIADGAIVREVGRVYFKANLDTYGGNSGSPVFNAENGRVEGILVRGETDYVYNSEKKCYETNYLPNDGGQGEDVTHITNIRALRNI